MRYWVIQKKSEDEILDKIIVGDITWKLKMERFGKRFRNPKNIGSVNRGDRFIIYFAERNVRHFCAEGTFIAKRFVASANAFFLTFFNRAYQKGFDEFPNSVNYSDLKDKINWQPIESSIHCLEQRDYRIIMSISGLRHGGAGIGGDDKSQQGSIPSIEDIAESSTRAMNIVKNYENAQGREPVDVSDKVVGFDIESRDKHGKVIRNIEVKSRKLKTPLALTDNEFKTAYRLGKHYFLYVVSDDHIHIVKDPAKTCRSEKKFTTVWHLKDWLEKAKSEKIVIALSARYTSLTSRSI